MDRPDSLQPAKKPPRPKPLLVALIMTAFFGGTCSVQHMMPGRAEPPSREDIAALLRPPPAAEGAPAPAPALSADDEALVDATKALSDEQHRLVRRFKPFLSTFGALLVIAYSFVVVFGLRALSMSPEAPRLLSWASLAVLPPRVALAAVETALARQLQPVTRPMATALARVTAKGVPPEQAAAVAGSVGEFASWAWVAREVVLAAIVCVFFYWASRYFRRPEVLALYEPREP